MTVKPDFGWMSPKYSWSSSRILYAITTGGIQMVFFFNIYCNKKLLLLKCLIVLLTETHQSGCLNMQYIIQWYYVFLGFSRYSVAFFIHIFKLGIFLKYRVKIFFYIFPALYHIPLWRTFKEIRFFRDTLYT
jgi:hypothetical protein